MSILPLICIGPKTGAPSFSKDMVRQWNFCAALIHSLLCEIQGRDEKASMGMRPHAQETELLQYKNKKWQMLIIIFLKIIRILYLLIMFAFCFRDQVFAKILELLSSLPAAKLLESNFEEVLRRGARTMLLEIRIHKCAVYWVHTVWRHVQDLVLQVILLIYTKKKR